MTGTWSSAAHQAALRLQEHIHTQGLRPGDRLGREDELLELLGVSRTVLREALRVLTGMHMIQIQRGPGGGVMLANSFSGGVTQLVNESVQDLMDAKVISAAQLLEARIALEVPLAGIAAQIAGEQMTEALLRTLEDGVTALMERRSVATSGAQFHLQIADLGMNRLVGGITSWMFDVLQPELERLQGNRVSHRLVAAQHREIYEGIVAKDSAAAEEAMRNHLRYLAEAARLELTT